MVKIYFAELSTPSARSSAHLGYVFQFSQVFSFPVVNDNKTLDNAKQVSGLYFEELHSKNCIFIVALFSTFASLLSANRGNTAKLSLFKTMKGLDISQSREKADDFGCTRPQNLTRDLGNSTDSSDDGHCLHRRRTLYLIRHGEAEHNVLEAIAQKKAKEEAQKLNLSSEETLKRMVSLRGLRTVLFPAERNGLETWATDIGNACSEARTQEKVCIKAGKAFRQLEGSSRKRSWKGRSDSTRPPAKRSLDGGSMGLRQHLSSVKTMSAIWHQR